jgi:hypothetical protein
MEAGVATECRAFLSGQYAGYLQRRGKRVPAWAWLGTLAHGDLHELGRVARHRDALSWAQEPDGLSTAVAHIARQIVELAQGDPAALGRLQSRALIPLEVFLFDEAATWEPTPPELVDSVQQALAAA